MVIELLQELPEPGRIYQNDVNQKYSGQGKEKNSKINQQNADADQNPMRHAHNHLPL